MNTLFIGQHIIELAEVDSTNTYAINLLNELNIPEGILIYAKNQTAGRGQMGNTWQAERGKNLTFSLILHPTFLSADKQFYLSKITSLAVFETLTEFLPPSLYDIKIKWSNDTLVNHKKISGILIENVLRGNMLQSSVIGVGININQQNFSGIENQATSLSLLLEKDLDVKEVLSAFCKHFEAFYLLLKQSHFQKITKQYINKLYRLNEFASYKAQEKTFTAKIIDVEESGKLVLSTAENEIQKFNFKEVQFVQ
jgi:BirA family biotin operon repressor/biotin-[acetyl-CoA-carboxylase] ligase